MDAGGDRIIDESKVSVIREIYDTEYSSEWFSSELERALYICCEVIVIEPTQLGDETARWIQVGNIFHKTTICTGLLSVASGVCFSYNLTPQVSFAVISGLCSILYTTAWQLDPCVKYQVEKDVKKLEKLPILGALNNASPVVLVRKENTKDNIIRCSISIFATAYCAFRLYRAFK